MTKEQEKEIKELIKKEIAELKDKEDEYLVHIFKIVSSKKGAKEKSLFSPLMKAIEKERKARGVKEIDSKIVNITPTKPIKGKGKRRK